MVSILFESLSFVRGTNVYQLLDAQSVYNTEGNETLIKIEVEIQYCQSISFIPRKATVLKNVSLS